MIFETVYVPHPQLFGQAIDNLDTREVAFMHGSIEGLASKCLLMNRAIGVAIKKTTEFVLKLTDTSLRTGEFAII